MGCACGTRGGWARARWKTRRKRRRTCLGGGVERLAGSGGRVWAGGWKWARRGEYLAGTRDAKNEGLVANRPARKGRGQTARDEDACSGASTRIYILYLCTVSPLLGVNEVCPPSFGRTVYSKRRCTHRCCVAENSAPDAQPLDPRGLTNESNQHDGPLVAQSSCQARIDERLMG